MINQNIEQALSDAKVLTKDGYINHFYENVINLLFNGEYRKKYHLKYWVLRPFTRKMDKDHFRMIKILEAFNIKYVTGNDAKMGGLSGDFISISKRDFNKLNKIKEQVLELL